MIIERFIGAICGLSFVYFMVAMIMNARDGMAWDALFAMGALIVVTVLFFRLRLPS